jgi:hypothetical protein
VYVVAFPWIFRLYFLRVFSLFFLLINSWNLRLLGLLICHGREVISIISEKENKKVNALFWLIKGFFFYLFHLNWAVYPPSGYKQSAGPSDVCREESIHDNVIYHLHGGWLEDISKNSSGMGFLTLFGGTCFLNVNKSFTMNFLSFKNETCDMYFYNLHSSFAESYLCFKFLFWYMCFMKCNTTNLSSHHDPLLFFPSLLYLQLKLPALWAKRKGC